MNKKEPLHSNTLSRYDLSYHSFRQLQRDYISFEQQFADKFANRFICRILINTMCYMQEYELKSFEAEILSCLLNRPSYSDRYMEMRIAFTKPLIEKMSEFKWFKHENFEKRTANRAVIDYILELYVSKPLSEREKIYFFSEYKEITNAIEKSQILCIKNYIDKEYEIKPYSLSIDDNSHSYYLVGYSKDRDNNSEYAQYSLKLSRIKSCKSGYYEFKLSINEKNNLQKIIDKFGSAYIPQNLESKKIEKTVVRLTKYGYETLFLKIISHQRPIPLSIKEDVKNGSLCYLLEFDCSYSQIRNYFFSFAKHAEIIEPDFLRKRFYSELIESLELYMQ